MINFAGKFHLFMRTTFISCLVLAFCFGACTDPKAVSGKLFQSELLPPDAATVQVKITDLNFWVEQGQFFVTGVCVNESAAWQQLWLKATFSDAAGTPLKIKNLPGAVVPVFSSAMPPQGRSAFFAGWPLELFSGVPASVQLACAGAKSVAPGPILLVEQVSGVRMAVPKEPGAPATEEIAWQISATINNILPQTAHHPQIELLLYGTDQRLWFSMSLNPEDEQFKQLIALDKTGPMAPGEKRNVGVYAFYERMPQALKEQKIGRADMLAFDRR